MLKLQTKLAPLLTTLVYWYRTPQNPASFQQRISKYEKYLDRVDRKFLIRPPDLSSKNSITFPITIPLRVRHQYNPKKLGTFVDNSSRVHWNRLTPNEILLGLEHIQYLEFNQLIEGLKYLSQVKGQQLHDWNSHLWVSKALDQVNKDFRRLKKNEYLNLYHLMQKLGYNNQIFWKKVYSLIEENINEMYPSQVERFFIKYFKTSDQYFSPEMKDKFLAALESNLRKFSPEGIVNTYQILQDENKLSDFLKFNAFVPLFKNQQYHFCPKDLHRIFRFMLIIGHEKDDRLYASLYKRLTSYETLSDEELDMMEEVIGEIKDLFVTHRVEPYVVHLKEMRAKMKQINSAQKKQIPIHQLVRQDLVFYFHQRKLKAVEAQGESTGKEQQKATAQ